jgi:hypothetical protein
MLLHDHESLRLAILNACEGARTSRLDPFAGTAQTLVQQGIPAVIAMQFEITDDVAGTFAHEFYGAVADGYPIDAAVTEARKAIFASGHDVEWGTPVLYLRAPDGRIFDVSRAVRPETADKPANTGRPPARSKAQVAAAAPSGLAASETPKERAAALVRDANVALAHGRFAEALKCLGEARSLHPETPNLDALTDNAEQQRAVAETRAARQRKFQAHLEAARDLCARGDLAGASRRVGEALKLRPRDPQALAVKEQIRSRPPKPSAPPPRESIAGRPAGGKRKSASPPGHFPDDERDLLD